MKFTPTRYMQIAGTEVLVQVNSAAEAKAAIKELKHKKREYNLLKRALAKQRRNAEAAKAKAERDKARLKKKKGLVAAVTRAVGMFGSNKDQPARDLATIEREIRETEEILHNLDSCALQLEGKLLTMG